MFTPLKSLLDGAMGRKPIRESVRVAVVLDAAREAIESEFSMQAASFMEPGAVRDGTITLIVRNPMISQEIKIHGAALLKKINERVGTNVVRKIRIRIDTARPV